MYWTVVCVLVVLVASGSACWTTGDDPEATPVAPAARALPSPTPTPEPTASPTPTSTSSPTPVPSPTPSLVTPFPAPSPSPSPTPTPDSIATFAVAYALNGGIEGYGYVPDGVRSQARESDLIARVKPLSVEPSFKISSGNPERRYVLYAHFSFSIIETLWGTPPEDGVVVVEYYVGGRRPTKAQAIEDAKKWIDSNREEWWNTQEAIIFLDDPRFVGTYYISEIPTGAHYSFADHYSCGIGHCSPWYIGTNDSYHSWVWLPSVGQDLSLEVPDSERMFRVVVIASGYKDQIAPASLADIKSILKRYWREEGARLEYVIRHRALWEAKSSDSYSFVYSHDDGRTFTPATKIVVRNGEAVEAFYVEDVEREGKVWPAGSRIEPENLSPQGTLELEESIFWNLAQGWAYGKRFITDVSFDYEFGYPTAIRIESSRGTESFFYVSDYTPLDN